MAGVLFTDAQSGETKNLTIEDETQINGEKYILVSERPQDERDDEEGEYAAYILKQTSSDEDEESVYQTVDDDEEWEAVAKIFVEQMDEDADLQF